MTKQVFTVIARFRNGSNAYLIDRRKNATHPQDEHAGQFTIHLRFAAHYASAEAVEEAISRLHRVQADGHYWQDVLFFDLGRKKVRGR